MTTPKKTTARKSRPSSSKPAATAAPAAPSAAPTATRYTWELLLPRVGAPTREDLELHASHRSAVKNHEIGADYDSGKILTDLLVWCGIAHDTWENATASQRDALAGYDHGLVRVLLHKGHELLLKNQQFAAQKGAQRGLLDRDEAEADRLRAQALSTRRRLRTILRSVVRVAPAQLTIEEVDAAFGTGADDAQRAQSLEALARLAERVMAERNSPGAKRLTRGRIDAAYVTALRTLAADVRSAGDRVSGPRVRTPVVQADIDRLDGECLELMEELFDFFELAHEIDPSIPRLVPLALRRYFFSHPKGRAGSTPAPPDTPPANPQ
jgi:hypothetical protein